MFGGFVKKKMHSGLTNKPKVASCVTGGVGMASSVRGSVSVVLLCKRKCEKVLEEMLLRSSLLENVWVWSWSDGGVMVLLC